MKTELNLNFDFNNKAEAAANLKVVQNQFDELLDVMKQQEKQLKENVKTIDEAHKSITDLTNSSVGFSDALKNIHITLNNKKDLWEGDKEMQGLMEGLATFVVSSGAIKLGVISNAESK